MKLKKSTVNNLISFGIVIIAFIVCQSMISTGVMKRSLRGQMIPICVYIVMAVSLNLVVGISGELSLGHAGFMSIGAFSGIIASAWLRTFGLENELIRLILSMVAAGVMAGVFGALIGIPVLRLRGDYLAIVTLAFGEIIRNVLNCLYFSLEGRRLHVSFNNPNIPGTILLNGPNGAKDVQKIATFPAGFVLILFTLFVVMNLINSRSGRAIMAARDNRIAAEAMGINVTKYKMMAFVTAAVLAGMAGALYGLSMATVTASKFKFDTSILVLVFVVLGGIGNIWGSIIAAALLTVLPELLRAFADYRMLIYAIVLILVMLVTNNPTMRALLGKLVPRRNGRQKGGAAA
ncbi:MAG: branched-chain amino acid ABC transporter permease [Clostridia bacterium]|nr:branched-chain amino acid ABC transporter permease [Clostridia bacterium]